MFRGRPRVWLGRPRQSQLSYYPAVALHPRYVRLQPRNDTSIDFLPSSMEEPSLVPDADYVRRIGLVRPTRMIPGTEPQQHRTSRNQDVQPQSATDGTAATMLCYKCRNMHFKPYKDCPLELQEAVIPSPFASLYYLHSPGLDSLKQTANSGCPFCKTIAHRILMDTELWNDTRVAGEQIVFDLSLNCNYQGVETPGSDSLSVYSCKRSWLFQCESDLPGKNLWPPITKSH